MYELNDTIVAVSSPTSDTRVILRMTGPETIETCRRMFGPPVLSCAEEQHHGLTAAGVTIDEGLKIEAKLYLFLAPHSYTGDDLAEIHFMTNSAVTEALLANLLDRGLRMAGPGEFTARAYLNGKIDLAQAKAVNEIIVSSNEYQLAAAEKLLAGRLAETTARLRENLMDCLSLIEAGLDFSGEDIEFITQAEAINRLTAIKGELEQLLSGSITYEAVIDLPSVGIAGAPNAGKSSLLNKLLGTERSIVSAEHKTTRDVLTAVCELVHCRCVLFDCAGLIPEPDNILDELAQAAAIEALRNSSVVVFCVDVSKDDWAEDVSVRQLIEPKLFIPAATKCDLVTEEVLARPRVSRRESGRRAGRLAELNGLFSADFLPISTETGVGVEQLRVAMDRNLTGEFEVPRTSAVDLTARHKRAVTKAMEDVGESIDELKVGRDEVTAMMLRSAHQAVLDIEQPAAVHTDEQILEQIFSRFCIGK